MYMHVCGVCLKYVGGGEQIRNDWHSLMNSSAQKHTCPPPPPPPLSNPCLYSSSSLFSSAEHNEWESVVRVLRETKMCVCVCIIAGSFFLAFPTSPHNVVPGEWWSITDCKNSVSYCDWLFHFFLSHPQLLMFWIYSSPGNTMRES